MRKGQDFTAEEVSNFWSHFPEGIKNCELGKISADEYKRLVSAPLEKVGELAIPVGCFEDQQLPTIQHPEQDVGKV